MFESLKLQNVSFKHGKKLILEGVNIEVKKGQKVAIVGKSGSGKTTLLKIMLGLLKPSEGEVLLNGKSIFDIDRKFICSVAGMLSQRSHIFSRTLRDNLLIAKEDATDEELIKVLERVGLKDFLNERSLNTMLGEGGRFVSGGEKSRIALARLILRDPELVILDEPLEGVDKEVEHEILENIKEFTASKTLVLVSHRFSILSLADEFIGIENGKVEYIGSSDEVLRSETILKRFLEAEKSMTRRFWIT